jgi:hypothetical protein
MTLLGVMVYKQYYLKTSLLKIYIWTTIIPMIFSIMQLLLIFRINLQFGLSDYVFSFGDSVITQLVASICFLPICIFFAKLCPDGSEGCVYAILTSYSNVAQLVAGNFSSLVSKVWDVSNKALKAGNVVGLWKNTVFTSLWCCVPLLFMRCMLPSESKQKELVDSNRSSRAGGIAFLTVLSLSILETVVQSILEIGG